MFSTARGTFGCLRVTGKAVALMQSDDQAAETTHGPIALAGRYAALEVAISPLQARPHEVVRVLDLKRGRVLRSGPAWEGDGDGSNTEGTDVLALVLKKNGSAAWLSANIGVADNGAIRDVWRADRRGVARLDSGPSTAIGSLRLDDRTLTWRSAGHARRATLR